MGQQESALLRFGIYTRKNIAPFVDGSVINGGGERLHGHTVNPISGKQAGDELHAAPVGLAAGVRGPRATCFSTSENRVSASAVILIAVPSASAATTGALLSSEAVATDFPEHPVRAPAAIASHTIRCFILSNLLLTKIRQKSKSAKIWLPPRRAA